MKICPTCRRTYDDDGLNFCLEDGSVLTFSAMDSAAPTIVMNPPRPTNPSQHAGGIQTSWDAQDQTAYSMQPKKKSSKAWIWVLGILGVLVLVCGGGFAGFFYYVASVANSNTSTNSSRVTTNTNTKSNSSWTNKNSSPSPETDEDVQSIDLAKQVRQSSIYGTTEYVDGELVMASKAAGFYYVLVTSDDYKTDGAKVRVSVRNPDDSESNLGYGLIFHSDTKPLEHDYAFLIDAKRKRFRVVRHEPEDEVTVTAWTSSNLIHPGKAENTLEARDQGEKIELYINGELATTITNKQGPKGGVPGLYSGDGVKAAFSKLEIVK